MDQEELNPRQIPLFYIESEKYCYVCKMVLKISSFAKNATKPGEVRPECRECDNKQRAERKKKEKAKDPEAVREKYLKKTYNLSLEEYAKMLKEQNNVCWICKQKKSLVVDHDHDTGKVRGLLCNLCNTSLGGFKDSRDSLLKALDYLGHKY
jgi:hypothetical protein